MKPAINLIRLTWTCGGLALLVFFSASAQAQRVTSSAEGRESVAAFIYSFTQHLEWPGSAFSDDRFQVCVLGNNELGRELDRAISGNVAGGHDMAVVSLTGDQLDAATACQVVYISNSESAQLDAVLGALDGSPVLTVSELDQFPENGGMIGVTTKGQSDVALRMHRRKIEDSGLAIQSSLRDALASL